MMKTCVRCKEIKPLGEFCGNKKAKDGLQSQCKECQRAWREEHSEEVREYNRKWAEENRFFKVLIASRCRAKRHGYLPCSATIKEIKEAYTGKCHACGIAEEDHVTKLCVDHDHGTGEFRGWLCMACNKADVLACV